MNLYKIVFKHYSPSDAEKGMKCLVIANNDEDVYKYLASDKSFPDGTSIFNDWKDNENYQYDSEKDIFYHKDNEYKIHDGWHDENGKGELFKNRMLRLKGEMNDKDYDFSESFYGITLYGWELMKENIELEDFESFIELKHIKVILE